MNELTIFNNEEFGQVRTVTKDHEGWLVGKDVATVLGYSNPRKALLDHVDEEDKTNGVTIRDSMGRNQNPIVINESGLYSLVLSSKLPNAKKFKRWVTSEVLPSIRQIGGYIATNETMTDDEIMAKALLVAQSTIQKKNELIKAKEIELIKTKEDLNTKNNFVNQISASNNSMLVRDIAHLVTKNNIKIGEKRLWEKLRTWGLVFKNSTKPMQKALEQGLFEVSQFGIQTNHGIQMKHTTRVTGKGQKYIIERLLKEQEA